MTSSSVAAFSWMARKTHSVFKADPCQLASAEVTERMVLQGKVHFLWGNHGSLFMKIINEVANKYKVIAMNVNLYVR